MNEVYTAYYRIRLVWAIVRQWLLFAVLVATVIWLGGCTSMTKPDMGTFAKDKADCEQAAAPARQMAAYAVYKDCMAARGYK